MLTVKGSNAGKHVARRRRELWVKDGRVTIEALPDEALLEVFDFYVHDINIRRERWSRLAHVCRRWRYVVLASPLRLDLTLYCNAFKPVRDRLDIWPPLPIVIEGTIYSDEYAENVIAALERNDRVCMIDIIIEEASRSALGRFARAMQEPFPELTRLELRSMTDETSLVLPEAFLGESAPRLLYCQFHHLRPHLALRNLLLSASHLLTLSLNIPHSGYVSPEAMVTCLSAVTSLKSLYLTFESPRSRPNRATRSPPPLMRTILPALTLFLFHGVSEYVNDFISRVNAPLLDEVYISPCHQLTFDVSQLDQFIRRTEALSALKIANVDLIGLGGTTSVELSRTLDYRPRITLSILCEGSDWQLSFLAQAFSSLSPTLSSFETLKISDNRSGPLKPGWEDDMEISQWLELFHPFTAVKNLYLSRRVVRLVAPALQELTEERVTNVLPVLRSLYLEGLQPSGPTQEAIGQFVAARQRLNHPVTVESWDGLN